MSSGLVEPRIRFFALDSTLEKQYLMQAFALDCGRLGIRRGCSRFSNQQTTRETLWQPWPQMFQQVP
jgi:hypothetical protein